MTNAVISKDLSAIVTMTTTNENHLYYTNNGKVVLFSIATLLVYIICNQLYIVHNLHQCHTPCMHNALYNTLCSVMKARPIMPLASN
jgi:hypothetical protein